MTTLQPPPEAQIIRERREKRLPRLSMREAASRAGISPAWWRMIETGRRRVAGHDFPERANDETLARMALVVEAQPAELRAAGRDGAAAVLEQLLAAAPDPLGRLIEDVRNTRDLSDAQKQLLIGLLRREHEEER